ncbi:hypothetical protein KEM54_006669 [Ascosphaera aggregata]|nr:hypothetical protein KEM54_006669 [Ascosphaera aggregata]
MSRERVTSMSFSMRKTTNQPSTQAPKQPVLFSRGITHSDIRIPSPHLHWDLCSDSDANEKKQAALMDRSINLCDSNSPTSDALSAALITIAEHPLSVKKEMSPTQQSCCCINRLKSQATCSEQPHSSQSWECYSSSSVIEEAYCQENSVGQDDFRCLQRPQQQQQNQLANDNLENPLICSTVVHRVAQNTNAPHTSTDYDPRHRSQQAIICSPDSPNSIYSPHSTIPGVFGVGGETPEMDKHHAAFDYGSDDDDNHERNHQNCHVRFKINSSSAKDSSSTFYKDDKSSVSAELLEPTKFDPKASMEIPITLDFSSRSAVADDATRTHEDLLRSSFEYNQGTPTARRPGLLPSALPDTFHTCLPEHNNTTCRKRSTTGPPAPPKDKFPTNLGQTPSPPESVHAYDRKDNPSLSSSKYNQRNEEYSVFPPRWQSLPFEQRRAINGQACDVQDNGFSNPAVRVRSRSNGAQHENDSYWRTHREDCDVTMASTRQVLESSGNLSAPFSRANHTNSDNSVKQRVPVPFESPRPPPLPPTLTEVRHATPRTPSHTHSRSEGSKDIQTPAQFSSPWRPQFNYALFGNSMSPATPSNDLHLQIQKMQRQLKLQQMQLEQLQAAGVEVQMMSPKSVATEQDEAVVRQQSPNQNYDDSKMCGSGSSNVQNTTGNKQDLPCRSGRVGSTSRLRSLSPSKIRIRRKQSPPKLGNPGSTSLNVVREKSTSETELSIDAGLANHGKVSPAKVSASDNVKSASDSSPLQSLSDNQSPRTPAMNSYMASKSQKAATMRSVSTPQNRKGWLGDVAEEKITATPRRGSDKDSQQNKTPRGSSLRGWGSKIMKSMQDLVSNLVVRNIVTIISLNTKYEPAPSGKRWNVCV